MIKNLCALLLVFCLVEVVHSQCKFCSYVKKNFQMDTTILATTRATIPRMGMGMDTDMVT